MADCKGDSFPPLGKEDHLFDRSQHPVPRYRKDKYGPTSIQQKTGVESVTKYFERRCVDKEVPISITCYLVLPCVHFMLTRKLLGTAIDPLWATAGELHTAGPGVGTAGSSADVQSPCDCSEAGKIFHPSTGDGSKPCLGRRKSANLEVIHLHSACVRMVENFHYGHT